MKILIISAPNPLKVSGLVAVDLYNALKSINGNEVKILVKQSGFYRDNNIISYESFFYTFLNRIINKFKKLVRTNKHSENSTRAVDPDYHVLAFDLTKTRVSSKKLISKIDFKPDAIIVLFMQNFLSYENLFELNKFTGAKVYQLLMDMAPFTGGCHYAWNCKGYVKKCGSCPALYSTSEKDQTRINWEYKKRYIDQTDITAIAASEWQWRQINKSSLFENKNKVKILSPTNSEFFIPGDKKNAKKDFNLDENKKIIFFGAVHISNRRKGFKELIEALELLYNDLPDADKANILIAIAGDVNTDFERHILFNVHFLGRLNHNELAAMYRASDIFLNSSIEDSGPTMINQAMMSGTPVVAFEMGVAPDLIKNGKTGYMAKLQDPVDFAIGIRTILELDEAEYLEMSENCRSYALSKCSLEKVGIDYYNLLREQDVEKSRYSTV